MITRRERETESDGNGSSLPSDAWFQNVRLGMELLIWNGMEPEQIGLQFRHGVIIIPSLLEVTNLLQLLINLGQEIHGSTNSVL